MMSINSGKEEFVVLIGWHRPFNLIFIALQLMWIFFPLGNFLLIWFGWEVVQSLHLFSVPGYESDDITSIELVKPPSVPLCVSEERTKEKKEREITRPHYAYYQCHMIAALGACF